MNKKGLEMFSTMISVFTLIILVTAGYFLVVGPKITEQERIIGKRAFVVFDFDREARIKKFMFDEGLKYASYSALVKFGEKGGDCEDWNSCKPNINKFKDYVKEEYLKVLDNLGIGKVIIESFTIDLKLESKYFIVSASNEEKFILAGEGIIYKSDISSFEKKIDYDLSIYSKLYEKYHERMEKCPFKKKFFDDLKVEIECDDSGKEIHINAKVKQQLLFIDPIIKFKVVKLGQVKRINK